MVLEKSQSQNPKKMENQQRKRPRKKKRRWSPSKKSVAPLTFIVLFSISVLSDIKVWSVGEW